MDKIALSFKNVTKKYEDSQTEAVDNISFDIYEGEFITILGSSGSGKTTSLKMMNKLIEPTSGSIEYFGRDLEEFDGIELRKNIGYVVQSIGLFPHMTIKENLSIVPKLQDWDQADIDQRVLELMDIIQIDPSYLDRFPNQLSGGQQQRIGLARALAANPKLMLMDEPLGALDAIIRMDLQKEIKNIHQELTDKTFIMVTHDINEAVYLGDRVMVMNKGKISQFDEPCQIINNPKTPYVQRLVDTVKEQGKIWDEEID